MNGLRFGQAQCILCPLVSLALCLLAPQRSFTSQSAVLSPQSVSSLSAPGGGSRFLIAMPDLAFLNGTDVLSAKLIISATQPGGLATIEARPVATAWTGAATWESPWTTAGGDFAPNFRSRFTFFPSSDADGTVVLDLTAFIQAYAESTLVERGIILVPPANEGLGFTDGLASDLATLANYELHLRYDVPEPGE